jgi:hypothetical protein
MLFSSWSRLNCSLLYSECLCCAEWLLSNIWYCFSLICDQLHLICVAVAGAHVGLANVGVLELEFATAQPAVGCYAFYHVCLTNIDIIDATDCTASVISVTTDHSLSVGLAITRKTSW